MHVLIGQILSICVAVIAIEPYVIVGRYFTPTRDVDVPLAFRNAIGFDKNKIFLRDSSRPVSVALHSGTPLTLTLCDEGGCEGRTRLCMASFVYADEFCGSGFARIDLNSVLQNGVELVQEDLFVEYDHRQCVSIELTEYWTRLSGRSIADRSSYYPFWNLLAENSTQISIFVSKIADGCRLYLDDHIEPVFATAQRQMAAFPLPEEPEEQITTTSNPWISVLIVLFLLTLMFAFIAICWGTGVYRRFLQYCTRHFGSRSPRIAKKHAEVSIAAAAAPPMVASRPSTERGKNSSSIDSAPRKVWRF